MGRAFNWCYSFLNIGTWRLFWMSNSQHEHPYAHKLCGHKILMHTHTHTNNFSNLNTPILKHNESGNIGKVCLFSIKRGKNLVVDVGFPFRGCQSQALPWYSHEWIHITGPGKSSLKAFFVNINGLDWPFTPLTSVTLPVGPNNITIWVQDAFPQLILKFHIIKRFPWLGLNLY